MIRFRQLAVVGMAALTLGACTQEIMTSHIWRPSTNTYFTAAAAPGPMLAVVVGNPFPRVSKATLDDTVIAAITNNHAGPQTTFVTRPDLAKVPDERIVVAFNIPRSVLPDRICGDTATLPSEPASNGRTRVLAGFCVGKALYSNATVSIPAVTSPSDPRFSHMLASAMWELVPTHDPFEENDSCRIRPCS